VQSEKLIDGNVTAAKYADGARFDYANETTIKVGSGSVQATVDGRVLTDPRDVAAILSASLGNHGPMVLNRLEALADRTTLVLGCGNRPVPGAVNHDARHHSEHVDVAWDLDDRRWPVPDARFKRIIALDVFEHLKSDVIDWLSKCWRILQDGGELVLRVSAWDNPVSYRDPTHRRFFMEESFYYFDPRHPLYREYGLVYYGDECPTFEVVTVSRGNADQRWPDKGDICAVLRKVARP
jgi:SAM-dependent methyltransferase